MFLHDNSVADFHKQCNCFFSINNLKRNAKIKRKKENLLLLLEVVAVIVVVILENIYYFKDN